MPFTATVAQRRQYNLHRQLSRALHVPKAKLRHKTKMAGAVSVPSATGVTEYKGSGPLVGDPAQAFDERMVWFHFAPKPTRGGDEYEFGRTSENRLMGQIPSIDDTGAFVPVVQDDWIVVPDPAGVTGGITYKIDTPTQSEDGGFWFFDVEEQK